MRKTKLKKISVVYVDIIIQEQTEWKNFNSVLSLMKESSPMVLPQCFECQHQYTDMLTMKPPICHNISVYQVSRQHLLIRSKHKANWGLQWTKVNQRFWFDGGTEVIILFHTVHAFVKRFNFCSVFFFIIFSRLHLMSLKSLLFSNC